MNQPAPVVRRWKFLTDLAERTLATYLQVFLGLLFVAWTDYTKAADLLTVSRSAAIAAIPSALAVIKGGLAHFLGDRDSASLAPGV